MLVSNSEEVEFEHKKEHDLSARDACKCKKLCFTHVLGELLPVRDPEEADRGSCSVSKSYPLHNVERNCTEEWGEEEGSKAVGVDAHQFDQRDFWAGPNHQHPQQEGET